MGRDRGSRSLVLLALVALLLAPLSPARLRGQAAPAQAGERVYLPLVANPPGEVFPFQIKLGDTVSENVPGQGAGIIESPGASDSYVFTVEADRQIALEVLREAPGLATTRWTLATAAGELIFNRNLGSTGIVSLPGAGSYTLTVGDASSAGTGGYSFRLVGIPLPDRFTIAVGDTVAAGLPAAGAGTIEQPFVKDSYSFAGTAGQRVLFDVLAVAPSLAELQWRLVGPDGRVNFSRVLGFGGGSDPGVFTLAATGTYTIIVGDNSDPNTGTYSFRLGSPPAPQQFALVLGTTVAPDAPGPGAGTIETPYQQDIYTFTAAAGQRVLIASENVSDALATMTWRLVAPDGGALFSKSLDSSVGPESPDVYTLPIAGSYSIVVGSDRDAGTGTYGFQLAGVAAPQQFAIAIGATVAPDAPGPGAGTIEEAYAQDVYSFTAAAGQRIFFELQDVSDTLTGVDWQMVGPDGRSVTGGVLGFNGVRGPTLSLAGTYTIVVGDNDSTGTGTYGFRLTNPPSPQRFAIAVGATVSDGVPEAGAGNLEALAATDIYTFTATAGQLVFLVDQNVAADLDDVNWRLTAPGGEVLFDSSFGFGETGVYRMPATGIYTIAVGADADLGVGTYEFRLGTPPAPEQFAIALGATVSAGVPAPGAGTIEAAFGQDVYSFTAAAGQRVLFDLTDVDSDLGGVNWRLVAPGGAVVFNRTLGFNGGSDPGVFTLPSAGTYTLVVGDEQDDGTGSYAFQTRLAPAPQQFAIAVGATISAGVPAPGAGTIEEDYGQDIYSFTGQAGQRVFVALQNVPDALDQVRWRLVAPDGSELLNRTLDAGTLGVRTLPATGTYTLIFGDDQEAGTGSYGFQLGLVAAPEQFAIAIGDTVAAGSPGPGAGTIESPAARDIYSFTAAVGQRISVSTQAVDASLGRVRWQLLAPDGRLVFDDIVIFDTPQVYTLRATGSYTLIVGDTSDAGTGSYGFTLLNAPAAQQFTIAIGDTIAEGVPAPGAGAIEAPFGRDVYSFTATAGQTVLLDLQAVAAGLDDVSWQLVAPDGSVVTGRPLGFGDFDNLVLATTGTYTLTVGSDFEPGTGSYGFQLRLS